MGIEYEKMQETMEKTWGTGKKTKKRIETYWDYGYIMEYIMDISLKKRWCDGLFFKIDGKNGI